MSSPTDDLDGLPTQPDSGPASAPSVPSAPPLTAPVYDDRTRALQYQALVRHLPDALTRIDHRHRFLEVNPMMQVLTGFPPHVFVGRRLEDLAAPSGLVRRWADAIDRAIATGRPVRVDYEFPDGAGRNRTWESTVVPEHLGDGKPPLACVIITRDITDQREFLASLEQDVQRHTRALESESWRLSMLIDNAPIAIVQEDWTGPLQLLVALRAGGVTDLSAALDADPKLLERCMRGVKIRHLNGMAHRLRPPGVRADNPALADYFNLPKGQAEFREELMTLWSGQRNHTARRTMIDAEGQPRTLLLTVALPSLDVPDQHDAFVCFVDVTSMDQLATRLDVALGDALRVNQELETFTYSVSHDLKAPLRGIDGYSRLLQRDHAAQLNEEGRSFLGYIRTGVAQMSELIEDLLAYSRLERRELGAMALDLHWLVQQEWQGALMALQAAQCAPPAEDPDRDAALRDPWALRGAPEAPPPPPSAAGPLPTLDNAIEPGLQVVVDPHGLSIAVRNLLDNAIKFTKPGQPATVRARAVRVEPPPCDDPVAAAYAPGPMIELTIEDEGIGFDPQYTDRIFGIFQRLQRQEDYPGTGVGLAMVRKAAERMGGSIRADGSPGRGARFTLTLPAAAR